MARIEALSLQYQKTHLLQEFYMKRPQKAPKSDIKYFNITDDKLLKTRSLNPKVILKRFLLEKIFW